MNFLNSKIFKLTFFSLILTEVFSFWGWKIPLVNSICFWALAVLVLILSLKKLEYGLYFIFAELFVGSFGYIFSFNFGGTKISLRVILFLIIVTVWLVNQIKNTRHFEREKRAMESSIKIPSSRYSSALGMTDKKWFYLFTAVLLLSFLQGILRGNGFANTFLDFNNWLYFLLILPVWSVVKLKKSEFTNTLISILAAATLFLSLKTLFLFYVFSHADGGIWTTVYKFIRDTLSGEVTHVSGNVWRVFLQSQIYLVISFFIFLPSIFNDKNFKKYIFLSLILAALLASFSRSFWVGLGAGIFVFLFFVIPTEASSNGRSGGIPSPCSYGKYKGSLDYGPMLIGPSLGMTTTKTKGLAFARDFAKILGVVVLAILVVVLVIILPPKRDENAFLSAFRGRFGLEAAASSRINQIKPLTQEILKSPVIGFGFGKNVTYRSSDPRIVPTTAGGSGEITTYAFEWGYLDLILKFGVLGMFIYLFFIYKILKRLTGVEDKIKISFALALVALLVVNIFSPYLNHPLGIGFIILISVLTLL